MTAAYEAARLGHQVDLFEKEKDWGGQLRYAGKPPFKGVYEEWGAWLGTQVKKMGVHVHLGMESHGEDDPGGESRGGHPGCGG